VGLRAIQLLEQGLPVAEVRRRLNGETGHRLDIAGFVTALAGAGLVASIGDRPLDTPAPARPSLPRLRAHHVRWTLHPLLHLALFGTILAGVVVAALRPEVLPGWRDLLWSEYGTPVVLGQIAVGWVLILLHELAHLTTARAAGVPGRIRLGTRLQFLVVQTEVSGIWLAERRVRMTVYLAGMTVDAALCAACVIAIAIRGEHALLSIVVLTLLMMIAPQFFVFMRTDVYFVLQDLTRCRNMYGDAAAYLRHLAARMAGRATADPLAHLSHHERRSLRWYALLLAAGTTTCLTAAVLVTVPMSLALLSRATAMVVVSPSLVAVADAAVVVAAIGGVHALWVWAWWRRHGHRVRGVITKRRQR
jgi:putative peptide zinc metalloprotease protein